MSDELSAALRELAASRATQPVVDGAGIRARATRRRRRRTVAFLGTGTAALVLVGLTLTPVLDGHPDRPAAPRIPASDGTPSGPAQSVPPSPSPTPSPVTGTLRPAERLLTVDRRKLPIVSLPDGRIGVTGPLTVTARHTALALPAEASAKDAVKADVPYVVELRDPMDRSLYIGTYTKEQALGVYGISGDWIGLDAGDAKWFYSRVRPGDRMALTTVVAPGDDPSARASATRRRPGA
ncbi:hypothetical protein [Streptomyces sp. NPDC093568]|uniref:hypothetical protein n=1 Tax=Streptomyces sp. NPDC093568 TaxID=3366041 RepID=UPI00382A64C6